MRHEPSGQYKWILHVKDHFSKYSTLYPLVSKRAAGVAAVLSQWIMCFGIPKIIQCDNGSEFKGALLILLRRHGIQCINGNPRSPQTQGLVEQGNCVVEAKIRAWKMDNRSSNWADALTEVALAINSQVHSVLGRAPYDVVFRQGTRPDGWLTVHERQQARVPNEDGTSEAESTIQEVDNQSPQPSDRGVQGKSRTEINPSRTLTTITDEATARTSSSDNDGNSEPDPVVEDVRHRSAQNAQKMIVKHSKKYIIEQFETGDIVALKIPRALRTSTDNRRLFCEVLDRPHRNRYQLRCRWGILDRFFPTKDLDRVEASIARSVLLEPRISTSISLQAAAAHASTSVRVRISCQCRNDCKTRRCRCIKEQKKCSIHCHEDEHDCGNLSQLSERTQHALGNPLPEQTQSSNGVSRSPTPTRPARSMRPRNKRKR